jgi:hypothetical protein
MGLHTIPLRSDLEHYSLDVSLDGATYSLSFRWNRRDLSWWMGIADSAGNEILAPRKMVVDWPLLSRLRKSTFPPGDFIVLDTANLGIDPGRDELGKRIQLVYADAEELEG